MPELPEIEVLKRSLQPHLVGDRIAGVIVRDRRLREPVDEEELRRRVAGRRIRELARRAKYLWIHLDGGSTLAVHLGMSGRLTLVPGDAPVERHEHIAFALDSGRRLRLRDPRRFGLVLAVATSDLETKRHFRHLGVEPLTPEFDGALLQAVADGRRGPIKSLLMDGSAVAGVGNIYACEALFLAGIHPRRSVLRIAAARWERLASGVRTVLTNAIRQGGTTLNDFTDGEGRNGYFQVTLAVYDREGEPCQRCGRAVRRIVQAGRSTFYCPRCQR